jgi:hypothetical protein
MEIELAQANFPSVIKPYPTICDDLVWLSAGISVNSAHFGWKAFNLSRSSRIRQYVPNAFVISKRLVRLIATQLASSSDLRLLQSYFDDLSESVSKALIVRSSSSMEKSGSNSFAGLFSTERNIRSFDELLRAIKSCYLSTDTTAVNLYAQIREVSLPAEHLGLIVQLEIPIVESALVEVSQHTLYIELFDRELPQYIRGFGSPKKSIEISDPTEEKHPHDSLPTWLEKEINAIVSEVRRLTEESGQWSGSTILEIIFDGKVLHILQANLGCEPQSLFPAPAKHWVDLVDTVLEESSLRLGVKGAAMEYFSSQGFFGESAFVFPPDAPISMIAEVLKTEPSRKGFTVRFSRDSEISLPRAFLPSWDEVVSWIASNRQHGAAIIVHPQLQVRSSFELLVSHDQIFLEHKPGMWESDSKINPDVLMAKDNSVNVWRVTEPRIGKFARSTGFDMEEVAPTASETIFAWLTRLFPIVTVLRNDFKNVLPLNFHFVEDTNGDWHFLNIRKGFSPNLATCEYSTPHVVENVGDLEEWDLISPILLRFTSPRGSELRVLEIAKLLPQRLRFPLIVDFGLLSHPAIVLRELGYDLIPSYLFVKDRWAQVDYEQRTMSIDIGTDPLKRIRNEKSVYVTSDIRVVRDREPISDNHLIVVSEYPTKSFADGDFSNALNNLVRHKLPKLFEENEWIFVERGRAQFCTSGLTESHAHAHLLPANRFKDTAVSALATAFGAEPQETLAAALVAASSSTGEYLLIVDPKGDSYLRNFSFDYKPEKRLIRNFFSAQLL